MQKTNRKTYPSDSSDKEWQLIIPHLPAKSLTGRPMKWDWRDLIDSMFYVLKTGCQWRALPGDLPPWQTVYRYFRWLRESQLWVKLNHWLAAEVRLEAKREANPSLVSLDSQSVKASETGSAHGFDGGKKIKGIKRHILVDTLGLLISCVVHSAAIADYDGAALVVERTQQLARPRLTRLKTVLADGIYQKERVATVIAQAGWRLEVVKRSDISNAAGFVVIPRRWVVERTFAWLTHNRRLVRDYERQAASAECFIYMSMCRLMLRRLAK